MASPTLADEQLEEQCGRRLPIGTKGIVILNEPTELGYRCPKGHKWDDIIWSEFKEHIWCYKCQLDYPTESCPIKRISWWKKRDFEDFVSRLP